MTAVGEQDFSGKIALVTGASRGIGKELAYALGAAGAQVIALARTVGGLEELDDRVRAAGGLAPVLVPHDLKEHDPLDHLGASLHQRFGRLDILIGAAAQLGTLSPCGHVDPKAWKTVHDVNLTANFRLLRSLDPLLRASDDGRAIFISDPVAKQATAFWGAYASSKVGLETLVRCYAAENMKSRITCNLFFPAPTRTSLRAQAYPGENTGALAAESEWNQPILSSLLSQPADSPLCFGPGLSALAPIEAN